MTYHLNHQRHALNVLNGLVRLQENNFKLAFLINSIIRIRSTLDSCPGKAHWGCISDPKVG
jgi:hypothetical protein